MLISYTTNAFPCEYIPKGKFITYIKLKYTVFDNYPTSNTLPPFSKICLTGELKFPSQI